MKEIKNKTQKILKGNLIATGILLPFGQSYASPLFYKVQKGDYFSKLAKNMTFSYGNLNYKEKFNLLKEVNPQIRDYNLIYPNQKINLPIKDEINHYMAKTLKIKKGPRPTKKINPLKRPKNFKGGLLGKNSYMVRKGDTLSHIADQFLGRPIFHGNAGALKFLLKYNPNISNPNKIERGQKINLPTEEDTALFQLLRRKNKPYRKKLSFYPKKKRSRVPSSNLSPSWTSCYKCNQTSLTEPNFQINYPFSNWKNKLILKNKTPLKFYLGCI
jgi:nucleoid-associated protein YgaU